MDSSTGGAASYLYEYRGLGEQPIACVAQTDQEQNQAFFRCAKWSPDGTTVATSSGDNALRLYNLSAAVMRFADHAEQKSEMCAPEVVVPHGETLLDYAWYPYMNQHDPATCCLVESMRDHPIQLRDSTSGGADSVRASYVAYDAKDVLMSASAVAFSADGASVLAGYAHHIARFDVQRPGLPVDLATTSPSRRSRDGMKGIVSCVAPPLGAAPSQTVACASFSGQLGLFHATGGLGSIAVWRVPEEYRGCGVTELRWAPNGVNLWAASRQSQYIVAWDVRDVRGPCAVLRRPCSTQQRMGFDFDSTGRHLVAGEMDGHVSIHDTTALDDARPVARLAAHGDLVAAVSTHPYYPLLATASGQRHFGDAHDDAPARPDHSLRIWSVPAGYIS
ncbi:hypothetical protein LPJ61_001824 [Coemansia biformis]|uniref:WD40 repeat-like protein n=1 Tax=Coemansia biformis TaxID=1286918 RepID=A0A9W8CXR4_9FUNG|nr:hypothetical protein LPJ61_001824 [Coemansia biformis]